VFAAILLGLLLGGASMQTVQAASTGTISGTVKDATSNLPITDFSIAVIAQNGTGATVRTTCSNPATGQYTLAQIPLGTAVRIVADGAASVASVAGCPGSSYSF
jgi:hypothetical protein